jgi:hypothetical protein
MVRPSTTPTHRLSTKDKDRIDSFFQFIKDDQSCQIETDASIQHTTNAYITHKRISQLRQFIKDDQSCQFETAAAKLEISSIVQIGQVH